MTTPRQTKKTDIMDRDERHEASWDRYDDLSPQTGLPLTPEERRDDALYDEWLDYMLSFSREW